MKIELLQEEGLILQEICQLVNQINDSLSFKSAIVTLQQQLTQEPIQIDEKQRKLAKKLITILTLYGQEKREVLLKVVDEVKCELNPEQVAWIQSNPWKQLSKKLNEVVKIPCRKLYISDCHFYHNALNKQMDCRGFKNHEEMNAYMIQKWNEKVTEKDEVYILGDFSIAKGLATNSILEKLKGKKYLIVGNHDGFLNDKEFKKEKFVWIKQYAEIKDDHRMVVLSHYPIMCYNGQYKRKEDVPYTYMLYGHVHDTHDERLLNQFIEMTRNTQVKSKYDVNPRNIPCQMINCFCKFSDYQPLTLDEWIALDKKRRTQLER